MQTEDSLDVVVAAEGSAEGNTAEAMMAMVATEKSEEEMRSAAEEKTLVAAETVQATTVANATETHRHTVTRSQTVPQE